jgi:uncharacterized lipoprotein YddW (UPF0748 family)
MHDNRSGRPTGSGTGRQTLASALGNLAMACFLMAGSSLPAADAYLPARVSPPAVARELRGVWITTVANIAWPSTNAIGNTAMQKAELIAMLDRAVELKLNTVILQVRPACDAIYPSKLEPWSEYLTGTMGKPPEPYYDPLAFAVSEAHERGLELHAWFNPYRARHVLARSPISANHISRTHPEWVKPYGKALWLDPGERGVQDYSLRVIMDVVRRYDIDGVHFDDYFYPQDPGMKDADFPDGPSWRRFGAGTRFSRDDWRRENVNTFVRRVYLEIKRAKPWVKFGISPHGIWRPGNPPQIKGQDAFTVLRADSRKWLMNGWVDYFAPQLYWAIDRPETSFPVLLNWWAQQNPRQRVLCPGLMTHNTCGTWAPEEIINQIRVTRRQTGVSGQVHYDMRSLMRNGALETALLREVYVGPALSPPMPWLENARPSTPATRISVEHGAATASWGISGAERIRLWLVQTKRAGRWSTQILPRQVSSIAWPRPLPDVIAVTAIDRCGNAGSPAVLEWRRAGE